MYLYIFLFTKPLKSSTLAADFKIEMKNISILYIMKQLLVSIAIVFASILTVTGQNHSFSLSGKWNFQIDREDARVDLATMWLELAGCKKIFYVNSIDGEGVGDILDYLREDGDVLPWEKGGDETQ